MERLTLLEVADRIEQVAYGISDSAASLTCSRTAAERARGPHTARPQLSARGASAPMHLASCCPFPFTMPPA